MQYLEVVVLNLHFDKSVNDTRVSQISGYRHYLELYVVRT